MINTTNKVNYTIKIKIINQIKILINNIYHKINKNIKKK